MSCCGRGGSWFNNCGGGGNKKLSHTWSEGIQACKARSQSKTTIGQHRNVAQQKGIGPSQGAGMANYKALTAGTNTFMFTSVNTSTPMSDAASTATPTYMSDHRPITTSTRTLMSHAATSTLMTSSTHTSGSTLITRQRGVHVLKIACFINVLIHILFSETSLNY